MLNPNSLCMIDFKSTGHVKCMIFEGSTTFCFNEQATLSRPLTYGVMTKMLCVCEIYDMI